MRKRIAAALIIATIGGAAALAEVPVCFGPGPMGEAEYHGGYNASEDRFVPEIKFIGTNLVSPQTTQTLPYGVPDVVISKDDLFVSKAAFDKLTKRVKQLEEKLARITPAWISKEEF